MIGLLLITTNMTLEDDDAIREKNITATIQMYNKARQITSNDLLEAKVTQIVFNSLMRLLFTVLIMN